MVPPSTLDMLEGLDRWVDDLFDMARGNATIDSVMYAASTLGDHSLLWVMVAAGLGARGRLRDARRLALGLAVESGLVNLGVKTLFRRRRPPERPGVTPFPVRQPLTSSFPSGHASAAAFVCTAVRGGDRLWPLYLVAGCVVAASRVHVRIHHASDVVAGAAVGAVLGAIARRLGGMPGPPPRLTAS